MNNFSQMLERDRAWVEDWMLTWDYQDNKRPYTPGYPQDFYIYLGPDDLAKWWAWQGKAKRPDYYPSQQSAELVQLSKRFDQRTAEKLGISFDFTCYDPIGRNNAQDYLITHMYPVPQRQQIRRVLDFGAGYGRQANLWSQLEEDLQYVAMDAIPQSYLLQYLYYSCLDHDLHEYMNDPYGFKISETGYYHLPTWRTDLLPDNHFDLVILTQVLPEINAKLVAFMIGIFRKKLKPGGALYLRDHGKNWAPVHNLDVDQLLAKNGFVLEFKPYVIDKQDIHGIPRIWRRDQ